MNTFLCLLISFLQRCVLTRSIRITFGYVRPVPRVGVVITVTLTMDDLSQGFFAGVHFVVHVHCT